MKKTFRRLIALLVGLSMLVSLAACRKDPTVSGGVSTVVPSSVTSEVDLPYYSAKEVEIFSAKYEDDWVYPVVIPMGDRIGLLLTIDRYDPEKSERTYTDMLYTYDLDGNQLSEADLSAFSGYNSFSGYNNYLDAFQSDGEGNIRAILRTPDENYFENSLTKLEMITLDPSGKETKPRVDLGTGTTQISDTFIDAKGRIYISESIVSGNIRILNVDGTPLGTIAVDSPNGSFFLDGETVYYDANQYTPRECFPIDPDALALGEPVNPETTLWGSPIETEGGYEIRQEGVYRRDAKSGELTLCSSWSTTYDPSLYSARTWIPFSAEKVIGIASYSESYRISNGVPEAFFMIILTKQATNPDINKKVLVLGGLRIENDPELRSAVFRFNRANENYRIEIRDYLNEVDFTGIEPEDQWNYEKKRYAELLSADFLNGKEPDILVMDQHAFLAPEILERQGYLVDLYALGQGDPSFRKEDYRTNILSLFERDGKLFRFPLTISLGGLVGPVRLLGDRSGWTVEECTGVLNSLPDCAVAFPNLERKDLLAGCIQSSLYSFVDYAEKTVDFDSDEFREILAFSDRFGSDPLPEIDDSGDIVVPEGFVDISELIFQGNLAIRTSYLWCATYVSDERYYFGEKLSFIGYPSPDRSGMGVEASMSLAICEGCPDPSAAWEFVRLCISEEFQSGLSIYSGEPMNLGASRTHIEKALSSSPSSVELMHTVDALTREDADQYIRLLDSASVLNGQDQPIIEIVLEEAAAYFAGAKTAEEVSRIIQDRVTTFVNERG
jgi:multiple sugar transport system substrate-binding protein